MPARTLIHDPVIFLILIATVSLLAELYVPQALKKIMHQVNQNSAVKKPELYHVYILFR